jgi:hypothetical protein
VFIQAKMEKEQIIKYAKIGAAIGVSFLLFRFIRKQIRLRKLKQRFGSLSTITNNTKGNKGGVTLPSDSSSVEWSPRFSAEALRDAMKGWGTTENKIWSTLDPLTSEQRQKVRTYFNTYFGDGDTLFEWFEGDLSGEDLQRAKAYFN